MEGDNKHMSSKEVDKRVVEMRFDNARFEKNVETSMSTLDKLNKKLNLTGATKGLENVDSAAKKVSFSNMENSLASLEKRFSTTGVIGMSVINNLTNSAMQFVSKIKGFVTGGIISGGIKRAMNLENAQFQLKGLLKDGDAVAAVMKNVNDAVDGTAYSLDAAASVASQLAASGMKAGDEMFSALRAVSGVAAMTNSSYEDIGRIFTQVAGQGRLMGDQLLQLSGRGMNAAATLATALGKSESEIRDMVSKGKIDFQTFAKAMDDAFGEHAKKANDTFNGALSNVKASLARIGAEFVTPLIKTNGPLVELFNALRERINDVKSDIGPFVSFVTSAATKMINLATRLIQKNPVSNLAQKIEEITKPAKEAATAVNNLGDVVDKVIRGDFGNGQSRFDALTKAGYDWAKVQNLVNEKLSSSKRYATESKDAQDDLNKTSAITIEQLTRMSDAKLKELGLTDQEVTAFRELEDQSKRTGISLEELVKNTDKLSGKSLIFNSLKNIGSGILLVLSAIGRAAKDVFKTIDAKVIYNTIGSFHKFTLSLQLTDDEIDKLYRTFKGLFALISLVTNFVGSGVTLTLKILSKILEAFDVDILDLTANMGDLIVKFKDFLFNNKLINKSLELVASGIKMVITYAGKLFDTLKSVPKIQAFLDNLKNIDLTNVGKNVIAGFENGLKDGLVSIPNILISIGENLLTAIKGVLGIHSPSRELYDVGQNTTAGFANGIKDGASAIFETIVNVGKNVVERFKNFSWGKIFAVGVSVTLLATVKKMSNTLENITAPLAGIGNVLSGVAQILKQSSKSISLVIKNFALIEKGFAKNLNANAFKTRASAVKDLAISLAILAASVYLLSKVNDDGQLLKSVGALLGLAVILGILALALDNLSSATIDFDASNKSLKFNGLKTGLLGLGVTLVLMAYVVKTLGQLDPDQYAQGFTALAGMIGALVLVFAAFGLMVKGDSAKNIDKAGEMLSKMAITLLLMTIVCKLAGKLNISDLTKGAGFAAAFLVFAIALAGISNVVGDNINELANSLIKISIAMGLMVGVCKLAGKLSADEIAKGAGFAVGFLVFVGVLTEICQVTSSNTRIAEISGLLLSISIAMGLMVGVCKLAGKLGLGEMVKGALVAGAMLLFVKGLVKVTMVGSKGKIAKVTGTLLGISIAMGVMAGVCILLSLIDTADLLKGVAAVGILGTLLAAMIDATKGANDVKGSIIAMSVAIAVMAVSVAALSFIDPTKLIGATAALSILMGMFSVMETAAGSLNGAMSSLIVMTVLIGALGIVVYELAKLPVDSVLGVAASLSLLLLSISASCVILSAASVISPIALAAAGVITLVMAAMAGILYLMKDMDPNTSLGNAKSLSLLIISLSASCILLGVAGLMGPAALVGVAALVTLITAIGGLMTAIGGLVTLFPQSEEFLNKGIPILEKIGYALGSFFGNVIGGFSAGVTAGLPEIGKNLSDFMKNLQPFINKISQIDESSLTGATALAKMIMLVCGAELMEPIRSWVPGASASMDKLSKQMDGFADTIVKFSKKVKGKIDEESVTAAANAGKIMAEMASTIPGTGGVLQFFTGDKDMSLFGTQLVSFGNSIVEFSKTVSTGDGINEEAVTAASNAGKIMTTMQSSIASTGGVLQFFTGDKDMSLFGLQLVSFGNSIVEFSNSVSAGDGISEEAVTAASNAGQIMTTMQKSIVPNGGVLQFFTGDKNMSTFGNQLTSFGEALTSFSQNTTINESTVEIAANAGTLLATLQESIPDDKWFDGKVSIDDFGKQIQKFGKYLSKYSNEVANINSESISASLMSTTSLVEIAKSLSDVNYDKIDDFDKIKTIGKAMKKYSKEVADIDSGAISNSVASANTVISISKSLYGTGGVLQFFTGEKDMSLFANQLTDFGKAMKSYSKSVSGMDTGAITNSVNSTKQMIALINSMSGIKTDGVDSFNSALGKLSGSNANNVIKSLIGSVSGFSLVSVGTSLSSSLLKGFSSNNSAVSASANSMVNNMQKTIVNKSSAFNTAGKTLGEKLTSGLQSKKASVSSATRSLVSSCSNILRSYYSSFYSNGMYLVKGFANGIQQHTYLAIARSRYMASEAYKAAKKELDVNSPSKKFEWLGEMVPRGMAKGIEKFGGMAGESAVAMAQTAIIKTQDALSNLAGIINGDIDIQPTITPVVDLTDVKNSAGQIGE